MAADQSKPCSRCRIVKPLDDFSPDKRARDGKQSACRCCCSAAKSAAYRTDIEGSRAKGRERYRRNPGPKIEYAKAYNQRHPERMLERCRRWRERHPEKRKISIFNCTARRRAQKGLGATAAEVREWAFGQKKVCYWCDTRCAKGYHIDHYEPLARGGKHEIGNLVIACGHCNLSKSAKDPFEFAKQKGRLL